MAADFASGKTEPETCDPRLFYDCFRLRISIGLQVLQQVLEILFDFLYLLLVLALGGLEEQGEVFREVAVAPQPLARTRDGVAFLILEVLDCLYDLDVFFTVKTLPRSILGGR